MDCIASHRSVAWLLPPISCPSFYLLCSIVLKLILCIFVRVDGISGHLCLYDIEPSRNCAIMALLLTTILALQFVQSALSEPVVSFPVNSQLPPVARINHLFSYSFSAYTFRSDSNITYTLGAHPSWLNIKSEERHLFGTPQERNVPPGEVVGQPVEIVATDDTGSISLNVTLVVSRNDAPKVKIPFSEQVEKFGPYSAPSSLLSYPSTTFKYSFDPGTFEHGTDLNYYAVSDDSSPLPAWMSFDTATLTFLGTTPSFETLVQPPQTFSFELVASDVIGFSASSISFSVVVGSHKLTTDNPTIALNTTRSSHLSYERLSDDIRLDDQPVKPGDLKVSTDGLPDWLSFNTDTWRLEGTPGQGDHSTNFTITFHDNFADDLTVIGVMTVATSLFASTFPNVDVMPGDKFDLDLASYFREPGDIKVSIDGGDGNDWLKLNGLRMSGQVPESATGHANISVAAVSKTSGLKETEILAISFIRPKVSTTTTTKTPKSTATLTTTSTPTDTVDGDKGVTAPGRLTTTDLLLATVIPVTFIALVLMLLVCFFRHRRTRRNYLSSKYRDKISKPVFSTLRVNGSDPSIRHVENEKQAPPAPGGMEPPLDPGMICSAPLLPANSPPTQMMSLSVYSCFPVTPPTSATLVTLSPAQPKFLAAVR